MNNPIKGSHLLYSNEREFSQLLLSKDFSLLCAITSPDTNKYQGVYFWKNNTLEAGLQHPIFNFEVDINVVITCADLIVDEYTYTWYLICGTDSNEIYIWTGNSNESDGKWEFKTVTKNQILLPGESLTAISNIYSSLDKRVISSTIVSSLKNSNGSNISILTIDTKTGIKLTSIEHVTSTDDEITSFDKSNQQFAVGLKSGNLLYGKDKSFAQVGKLKNYVSSIRILDGNLLAVSSKSDGLLLWSVETKQKKCNINTLDEIIYIDYNYNTDDITYSTKKRKVHIWNISDEIHKDSFDFNEYYKENFDKYRSKQLGQLFPNKVVSIPNSKHLFVLFRDEIFMIEYKNIISHLISELNRLKSIKSDLFLTLNGFNLIQLANNLPIDVDSIKKVYEIIKHRLITHFNNNNHSNIESSEITSTVIRELSELYIYQFIEIEEDTVIQKEYLNGVRNHPDSFWHSIINNDIHPESNLWSVDMFITTDTSNDLNKCTYTKIASNTNVQEILLKDRNQTLIQFLIVLKGLHISLLPLIKNTELTIENDKGQRALLTFSDFEFHSKVKFYGTNNEAILSLSNFKLDESYNIKDYANFFVRDIKINYNQTLSKLSGRIYAEDAKEILRKLMASYISPTNPRFKIRIGKGLNTFFGKLIDTYFTRLIVLNFVFSIWGFWEAAITPLLPQNSINSFISKVLAIAAFSYAIYILFAIIIKKLRKKNQ